MRSRVDELGQSGFVHPTGTETTAHEPLDVGTSLRSPEIGAPHTAHNREFATIEIIPIQPTASQFLWSADLCTGARVGVRFVARAVAANVGGMLLDVATSVGPGRLTVSEAAQPEAVLWLGHGAGGGIDAADLAALAGRLPELGVTVIRYEQPWRVAGKRVAARPQTLDVAWLETTSRVRDLAGDLPLVVGGRSAGARVACRTAASIGAAAVVCLAFPLSPPGRPDTSRLDELLETTVPVLVLQGGRDTFGTAADLRDRLRAELPGDDRIRVVEVSGADHGMRVLKDSPLGAAGVRELLTSEVAGFVRSVSTRP